MNEILKSSIVNEIAEIINIMYQKGWDERNGGNISYLFGDSEISSLKPAFFEGEFYEINLDLSSLNNKYLLVTASGVYFKNVEKDLEKSLGIIKILDEGSKYQIVWGFKGDGRPSSELESHLLGHVARLSVNPKNKIIMHSHPTNLIAMSFIHDLDEKEFTKTLWKMMTECIVVFPEGIGTLPWMVCGYGPIGGKTAEKLKDYRSVLWPMHGLFIAGDSVDDAFGLLETIEKAALLYIKINQKNVINEISDLQLEELAKAFNVVPKGGILGNNYE